MYYLLFAIFYLISLLPIWALRGFGAIVGWIAFRAIGYRRKVVLKNLQLSFPNKTAAELRQIEIRFYRHFTDTWMETIKMMTITRRQVGVLVKADYSIYQELFNQGKSAQLMTGHAMNWEVYNMTIPDRQPLVWLGVYMHLSNPVMERLFFYLRGRFGTVLIPAREIKTGLQQYQQQPYLLGLGADQSPNKPADAHWMMFLNQPTAFPKGPARNAVKNKLPIIFTWLHQPRRGKYELVSSVLVHDASQYSEAEITRLYVRRMEAEIVKNPANYLWSHRRWKHSWKPEYAPLWMDESCPPPSVV